MCAYARELYSSVCNEYSFWKALGAPTPEHVGGGMKLKKIYTKIRYVHVLVVSQVLKQLDIQN